MTTPKRCIMYPPFVDILHALEQHLLLSMPGARGSSTLTRPQFHLSIMPSPPQQQSDAYTYESQNDQRLDELHSKLRSLRGVRPFQPLPCAFCANFSVQVTTDIYDDVERQNLLLDDTSNSFSSFANSLTQSGRHFTRAFGGTKTWRIGLYTIGALVGLWLLWKIFKMFWYA